MLRQILTKYTEYVLIALFALGAGWTVYALVVMVLLFAVFQLPEAWLIDGGYMPFVLAVPVIALLLAIFAFTLVITRVRLLGKRGLLSRIRPWLVQ